MSKPEHTSKRVAKIAERILAHKAEPYSNMALLPLRQAQIHLPWSDIRSLASYVHTHASDHAEREAIRKGKIPKGHVLIRRHKPVVRNHKGRKR